MRINLFETSKELSKAESQLLKLFINYSNDVKSGMSPSYVRDAFEDVCNNAVMRMVYTDEDKEELRLAVNKKLSDFDKFVIDYKNNK